jgi:hypothetical protein
MKSARKWRLGTVALFAIVLAFLTPNTVHRRDFDQAYFRWRKDPSAANTAEFERQRAIHQRYILAFDALDGMFIFVVVGTVVEGLAVAGRAITTRLSPPLRP